MLTQRRLSLTVSKKRASCFYFFEESLAKFPDHRAIWSREGSYTLEETYEKVCQYAAFFLEQDVRPGQLVAFYLQNQPEFIFAWLGLWAIVRFTRRMNQSRMRFANPK